jgi:hypothetical protein
MIRPMRGASSQLDDPFSHAITFVVGVAKRQRFRVALTGGFALAVHGVPRASDDVEFLVEEAGAAPLHEALTEAGARCVHRSDAAAHYGATLGLAPLAIEYAQRERAREMLDGALPRLLRGVRVRVPVIDAEAVIELKLEALAQSSADPAQDEADIRALLARRGATLNLDVVRGHFRRHGREADLERLLAEARAR